MHNRSKKTASPPDTIEPIPRSKAKPFQIVVALLLFIGIGGFICFHRGELGSLAVALHSGRWYWLLIAAVLESIYILNEAFCFSLALRLTGTRISASSLVPVLLGAQTVSVMAPSEFLADQSLFYVFAMRHSKSPTRVGLGVSVAEMAELFSFMAVLIAGFLFLAVYRTLQPFEVAAGIVISLLCFLLVAAVVFLLLKPQSIARILAALQKFWNGLFRVRRRNWRLPQDWAIKVNRNLVAGIEIAGRNPRGLVTLLFVSLAGHLLRIACLFAVIEAFGLSFALWKVTTAYAIGTLVWIASPIPGGIGLVESAYGLVFVSLGIPAAAAATLALAYRGVTFWLPLAVGIVCLRVLAKRGIAL